MMMKLYWKFRNHFMSDDGIGVVEMILILVVLIALVIIFKNQLTTLVNDIFSNITTNSDKVMGK